MSRHYEGSHRGRRRGGLPRRRLIIAATAVALALITVFGYALVRDQRRAEASRAAVINSPTTATPGATAEATGDALPITDIQTPAPASASVDGVGVPVTVSIARLGIRSTLQHLGVEKDGTLQSPSDYNVAGWYAQGARPGQVGPAVIAGHVDSTKGPAVFYRLPTVKVGDEVAVADDQGVTRWFSVYDVETFPKSAFPSAAVYGPAGAPVLRLITCYGAFDEKTKSYVDNIVVSAALEAGK